MKNKIVENALYVTLALCLIAQIIIRGSYITGQFMYLAANLIAVFRTFSLKRPIADKVKDTCFLAVTAALIGYYFISIPH